MNKIKGVRLILAPVIICLALICNCAYLYFIDGLSAARSIKQTVMEFANYLLVLAFALVVAFIILFVWNKVAPWKKANNERNDKKKGPTIQSGRN